MNNKADMTLIIETQKVMVIETLIREFKLYMLVPLNAVLLWFNIHLEEFNIMSFIQAYVPFSVIINALGQVVTVAGSIALLYYTRHKFLQDMRNKKLEADIKLAQLEEIRKRAGISTISDIQAGESE